MHRFVYLFIPFIVALLWFWRYEAVTEPFDRLQDGALVRIKGVVSAQPYQKGSKDIIKVSAINASIEGYSGVKYGDKVELSGRLDKKVTDSLRPQLWLWDPTLVVVNQEKIGSYYGFVALKRSLLGVRAKLMQLFGRILPEPQSSLMSGITLGVKRRLPYQFSQALRNTGTLHVVVASGYNVTVVAGVIAVLVVQVLSRRWAIPFILVGVGGYTIMAGADPPIVRAAIMGSLAYVAQMLGRQYTGLWALVVASIVMLMISPLMLFDIGFQLSVAATCGILLLVPIIARKLWVFKKQVGGMIIEEFAVTLGAQLMVFPLLLIHFGQVSWLSPLVNLGVGFSVPIIMGLGGIIALAGIVSFSLAQFIGLFAWVPLTYFVGIVEFSDGLPFGVLKIPEVPWWTAGLWYLFLGLFIWRGRSQRSYVKGGFGVKP